MWGHAYRFWKIPPSTKRKPLPHLLISLQNFPIFLQNLMTFFLRVILSYRNLFYLKNWRKKVNWFCNFCTPPRLFQPPWLLERCELRIWSCIRDIRTNFIFYSPVDWSDIMIFYYYFFYSRCVPPLICDAK